MPDIAPGDIAVVTGASGFIGRALVDVLAARGVRVRCLTRRSGMARDDSQGREIAWHAIDWSDPAGAALERAGILDGARWVFHLAGTTKALDEAAFRAGNVVPTRALAESVVRRGIALERFVLVSSQAAAGPAPSLDAPRREHDPPEPVEAYGRSKLEAERSLASSGVPFTVVRPASVYGPRDVDFLQVFRQVRSGFWIYPATRDRWLSIVHVDDVVRGMIAVAESSGAERRTYFIAGEPPVSWREVYRAAAAAVGARRLLELDLPQFMVDVAGSAGSIAARLTGNVGLVNAEKVALGRPSYWVCSTALAAEELGFRARIGLSEGMTETGRWYREQGWVR
jgi:nucleoside-diphosphate-sugar epimerase